MSWTLRVSAVPFKRFPHVLNALREEGDFLVYFRNAMKITDILAIAGKPGLYKVLASGSASIVVESMLDGKRSSVSGASRVSNLADITMYTMEEDVPLRDILNRIHEAQKGAEGPSHKDSAQGLRDFIDGIVPELDHDRVYQSDLKKLVQWYNILTGKDAFPLELPETEDQPAEEAKEAPKKEAKKPAAKKAATKKPAAKKAPAKKAASQKTTKKKDA